jgi:putative proteasome-type protease
MTFCLGMNLEDGLVGIADTRITTGTERITARKLNTFNSDKGAFFVMTSGLRSLRDKTIIYFEEAFDEGGDSCDRLYKVCNMYSERLRKVAKEDKETLDESGLHFNLYTILGGQMLKDDKHKLYLIYPQGNWVEVGEGTPYTTIGNSTYGKPVLDRTLSHGDTLKHAFRVGCLAFDSTRNSAVDVELPMDVVVYRKGEFTLSEARYDKSDFIDLSTWWQGRLRRAIEELPMGVMEHVFDKKRPDNIQKIGESSAG